MSVFCFVNLYRGERGDASFWKNNVQAGLMALPYTSDHATGQVGDCRPLLKPVGKQLVRLVGSQWIFCPFALM